MAAAKKHKPSRTVFLSDPEIREFEAMDDGQLSAFFFQNGVGVAAEIVRSVIASYRITARVANAGWKLAKAIQEDKDVLGWIRTRPLVGTAFDELVAALSDYSPGNWPPPRTEREHAMHILEKLYEEATRRPSWESSLEAIYQAVSREYEEANK